MSSWKWKGIPIPILIAIVVLIIAGIIHIVGIATPNWHEEKYLTSTNTYTNAHYGLWVQCNVRGAVDTFDCQGHTDGTKSVYGFIEAVRALEIIGLLFGAAAIILIGLFTFLKIETGRTVLKFGGLAATFLAGLFSLIGIIVYGASLDQNQVSHNIYITRSDSLSWSFAMCVISSILCLISALLVGLGIRMS